MAFKNTTIRAICEDENKANTEYGIAVAKDLKSRLADLDAADTVYDLLTGSPTELLNKPLSNYKIDLCEGFRLVFCANHTSNPKIEGNINWGEVTHIKILDIEKNE